MVIFIFPWSVKIPPVPNSLTTGVPAGCSLYVIPKIPIDWFPFTFISPALSTLLPFTAYTPTALSLTVLAPFSTSTPAVAAISILPKFIYRPIAPAPASVLSAITLEPAARFIWASDALAAALLELISSPTTCPLKYAVASELLISDFTFIPLRTLRLSLCPKNLL